MEAFALRARLHDLSLQHQWLAARLGCSKGALSNILKGRRRIAPGTLVEVVSLLRTPAPGTSGTTAPSETAREQRANKPTSRKAITRKQTRGGKAAERGVPARSAAIAFDASAPNVAEASAAARVSIDDVIIDAKLPTGSALPSALALAAGYEERSPTPIAGLDARLWFRTAPPARDKAGQRRPRPFRREHNVYDARYPHSSSVARVMLEPVARFCREHHRRGSRSRDRDYYRTCAACRETTDRQASVRVHLHGGAARLGATAPINAALVGPYAMPKTIRLRRLDVAFDFAVPASALLPVFGASWSPKRARFHVGPTSVTRYFEGPRKARVTVYDLHACAAYRRETGKLAPDVPAHARAWAHATRVEVRLPLDVRDSQPVDAMARLRRVVAEMGVLDLRTVSSDSPLILQLLSQLATGEPTSSAPAGPAGPAGRDEVADYIREVPRVHLRDVLDQAAPAIEPALLALASGQPG